MTTTEPNPAGVADSIDMSDVDLIRDPFYGYSRIREQAPLVRAHVPGVDPGWLVTRYDDVKMVLTDARFASNPTSVPGMDVTSLGEQVLRLHGTPPQYLKYRLARLGLFDAPDNPRLRGLVSHAFTVGRVAQLRPLVEDMTENLLDRLPDHAEDGVVDLLARFAHPLGSEVLCEIVGIPEEDRPRGHGWYKAIWTVSKRGKDAPWREMLEFTQELIDRRRAEPADDLVSDLVRAHDEEEDLLSEVEMIAMIIMLAFSARQTSAHQIGNGALALLAHPDQLALLRDNPELMPRAIHELFRCCSPTPVSPRMRYATEDVEIGGMPVRKGEALWVSLGAANFDPRKFDDPDRFDITREPEGRSETHVAFAGGPHYCLGAALARMESEVAFEALPRRYPNMSLAADPADLDYEPMPFQWRLTALPVRLGAAD